MRLIGCFARAGGLIAVVLWPLVVSAADNRVPVCINCHAKETEAYLKSAMGNSIAAPALLAGGNVTGRTGAQLSISEHGEIADRGNWRV